jgi:dephospho-CoA kinase
VGLTGGVASGKSTVAQMMRELGAVVVDSDRLAREVVDRGTPGLARVVAEFGPQMLTDDGELDRARLASVVFADEAARKRLEAILHPLIGAASAEVVEAAPEGALVVQDVPLLVEAGMAGMFDAVVVVDAPVELQVERMMRERGMTEQDARARIAAQATPEQRRAAATYVVENSGSTAALRQQVEQLVARLAAAG